MHVVNVCFKVPIPSPFLPETLCPPPAPPSSGIHSALLGVGPCVSLLSSFLCRRAFPRDFAILIRLVIHLRARDKWNGISFPARLVLKSVLINLLYSNLYTLNFCALPTLFLPPMPEALLQWTKGPKPEGRPQDVLCLCGGWSGDSKGVQFKHGIAFLLLDCCCCCYQGSKGAPGTAASDCSSCFTIYP